MDLADGIDPDEMWTSFVSQILEICPDATIPSTEGAEILLSSLESLGAGAFSAKVFAKSTADVHGFQTDLDWTAGVVVASITAGEVVSDDTFSVNTDNGTILGFNIQGAPCWEANPNTFVEIATVNFTSPANTSDVELCFAADGTVFSDVNADPIPVTQSACLSVPEWQEANNVAGGSAPDNNNLTGCDYWNSPDDSGNGTKAEVLLDEAFAEINGHVDAATVIYNSNEADLAVKYRLFKEELLNVKDLVYDYEGNGYSKFTQPFDVDPNWLGFTTYVRECCPERDWVSSYLGYLLDWRAKFEAFNYDLAPVRSNLEQALAQLSPGDSGYDSVVEELDEIVPLIERIAQIRTGIDNVLDQLSAALKICGIGFDNLDNLDLTQSYLASAAPVLRNTGGTFGSEFSTSPSSMTHLGWIPEGSGTEENKYVVYEEGDCFYFDIGVMSPKHSKGAMESATSYGSSNLVICLEVLEKLCFFIDLGNPQTIDGVVHYPIVGSKILLYQNVEPDWDCLDDCCDFDDDTVHGLYPFLKNDTDTYGVSGTTMGLWDKVSYAAPVYNAGEPLAGEFYTPTSDPENVHESCYKTVANNAPLMMVHEDDVREVFAGHGTVKEITYSTGDQVWFKFNAQQLGNLEEFGLGICLTALQNHRYCLPYSEDGSVVKGASFSVAELNAMIDDLISLGDLAAPTLPAVVKTWMLVNKTSHGSYYFNEPDDSRYYIIYGPPFMGTSTSSKLWEIQNFPCLDLDITLNTDKPEYSPDPKICTREWIAEKQAEVIGYKDEIEETIVQILAGLEANADISEWKSNLQSKIISLYDGLIGLASCCEDDVNEWISKTHLTIAEFISSLFGTVTNHDEAGDGSQYGDFLSWLTNTLGVTLETKRSEMVVASKEDCPPDTDTVSEPCSISSLGTHVAGITVAWNSFKSQLAKINEAIAGGSTDLEIAALKDTIPPLIKTALSRGTSIAECCNVEHFLYVTGTLFNAFKDQANLLITEDDAYLTEILTDLDGLKTGWEEAWIYNCNTLPEGYGATPAVMVKSCDAPFGDVEATPFWKWNQGVHAPILNVVGVDALDNTENTDPNVTGIWSFLTNSTAGYEGTKNALAQMYGLVAADVDIVAAVPVEGWNKGIAWAQQIGSNIESVSYAKDTLLTVRQVALRVTQNIDFHCKAENAVNLYNSLPTNNDGSKDFGVNPIWCVSERDINPNSSTNRVFAFVLGPKDGHLLMGATETSNSGAFADNTTYFEICNWNEEALYNHRHQAMVFRDAFIPDQPTVGSFDNQSSLLAGPKVMSMLDSFSVAIGGKKQYKYDTTLDLSLIHI